LETRSTSAVARHRGFKRYRSKISGPLLDRIDLHIEAPALSIAELRAEKPGEYSALIRQRVKQSRARQHTRSAGSKVTSNARMTHGQIRKYRAIDATLGDLLQHAMEQLSLSARAYDRILKVARTIADLAATRSSRRRQGAEAHRTE
jgi:magnesium chelatase family protein